MEKRFLTVKEFCELTRISRTTLHRHMKNNVIPFIKIGGRVLIETQIINDLAEVAKKQINEQRV